MPSWEKARFGDVVDDALRVDALTIPRPGIINDMEWTEVDWDAKRWTIPAVKMKTDGTMLCRCRGKPLRSCGARSR